MESMRGGSHNNGRGYTGNEPRQGTRIRLGDATSLITLTKTSSSITEMDFDMRVTKT